MGRRKTPATAANPVAPPRPLRLEYRTREELADNPANWRRHPPNQLAALKDLVGEVGWAGACLFNERTGRLIDGHARKEVTAPGLPIPVLVGSWSAEDEAKILATLDPVGALAAADHAALEALLGDVQTQSEPINQMLADLLAAEQRAFTPATEPETGGEPVTESDVDAARARMAEQVQSGAVLKTILCPHCGREFQINPANLV